MYTKAPLRDIVVVELIEIRGMSQAEKGEHCWRRFVPRIYVYVPAMRTRTYYRGP